MNISSHGRQPYAPALALGLGGLIPFVMLPLLVIVLDEAHQEFLLHALVLYGAVICTFVGALQWGYAVRGGSQQPWLQCGWSIVPALISWIVPLLAVVIALRILACLLLACYIADRIIEKTESAPEWFIRLRGILTVVGSGSLLAASFI